jgi:hypothetical protein
MMTPAQRDFLTKRVVSVAYQALLLLPLDSILRHRLQGTLCLLRDEIARMFDKTPEQVQTDCEAMADKQRVIYENLKDPRQAFNIKPEERKH